MRRVAGSKRSAIPPTSPPRSPSISPSRPTCRCSSTRSRRRCARRESPPNSSPSTTSRRGWENWRRGATGRSYGRSTTACASIAAPRFPRSLASRASRASAARPPRRISARTSSRASRSLPPPAFPCRRPGSWKAIAEIAALGDWPRAAGPLFVKPNTLGAKIGIFADSLCRDRLEANDRARRIWERYRDRALIQPFVEGDDVRVSFMDLGGEIRRSVRRRTDRQGP